MTKEAAKRAAGELVEKFKQAEAAGALKRYSEEDTKKNFIMPLFRALGWDVDGGEVSAEETISGKRVDYGFYIDGRAQFYLEAKAAREDTENEKFANQASSYSWNKGVTWAVLTNFRVLEIFNAESATATVYDKRFKSISYEDYAERFEELWLLSKEAFREKLLDAEAEKVGKKLKRVSVTAKLVEDLNDARALMSEKLLAWNPQLQNDPHLLDEGVQRILDRIIFIRVAEDRGIEEPTLRPLVREWSVDYYDRGKRDRLLYQAMEEKFRELDAIYNSNIFAAHASDTWEDQSNVVADIIEKFYGKEGYYQYDFKVIPADILGTVYEQYLGHRLAKLEKGDLFGESDLGVAKDARKRKEQGIYYTPRFIVDYIVEQALGPVLAKCKTVADLQKIKVLDPACGSGSFLIKALELIYKRYEDMQAAQGGQYLKLRILQDNLYGVDLDEQAVEIARLNLLIASLEQRMKMPNLDNIKVGNSLISGTDEELKKRFGKEWREKKPFNWEKEFPEVFKQGGFDVVIGNPPYIFARGGSFNENEKAYYTANYKLQQYQINTFLLFIERGYNLLKKDGSFGFIIPNNWLTINSFSRLREFLLKNVAELQILNAAESVFDQASVDTCLLLFRKASPTTVRVGELKSVGSPMLSSHTPKDFYRNEFVIHISQVEQDRSIEFKNTVPLGDISQVSTGLKAYQIGKGKPPQDEQVKLERKFHSTIKNDKTFKPYLQGVDVKRYYLDWSGEYLSYGDWLAEPRKSVPFSGERILVRQIPSPLPYCVNAAFTAGEFLNDINSMVVFNPEKDFAIRYILAILNSRLMSEWFVKSFDKFQRKIFPQFKVNELARFPIYKAAPKEQKKIVILVGKMLDLQKELHNAAENSEKWNKLKTEIERTDKEIDQEVYKLYDLTEEEIKVIENT